MTQPTFAQLPLELIRYVRSLKLSGTQYDLWLYLWERDPFGDRFVEIPSPTEIAVELGVNPRTITRAAQRLQDADLFDFQIDTWKCRNTTTTAPSTKAGKKVRIRTKRSSLGQFDPIDDNLIQMSSMGSKDPNVSPEPPQSKDSGSLQTIQKVQTNQTKAVAEKISEEENTPTDAITTSVQPTPQVLTAPTKPAPQVKQQNQESSSTDVTTSSTDAITSGSSFTHISNTLASPPNPQQRTTSAPTEKYSQIPQDLRNKLEELEIPLDGRVRKAIASHDISQAYGAVAHVERTWETINNPRGVFLFQISRQPVEPMGARLPVKTSQDWDFTLEYIKKMYPNNWQDAAAHFGVEVES